MIYFLPYLFKMYLCNFFCAYYISKSYNIALLSIIIAISILNIVSLFPCTCKFFLNCKEILRNSLPHQKSPKPYFTMVLGILSPVYLTLVLFLPAAGFGGILTPASGAAACLPISFLCAIFFFGAVRSKALSISTTCE